jgi:hypothetical protein
MFMMMYWRGRWERRAYRRERIVMGDSEAVDVGRGSPKVRREVLGLQEQIIRDIHGEGLGHHGVEGEEVNGAVVGPIGREGIRRHVVRHVVFAFGICSEGFKRVQTGDADECEIGTWVARWTENHGAVLLYSRWLSKGLNSASRSDSRSTIKTHPCLAAHPDQNLIEMTISAT